MSTIKVCTESSLRIFSYVHKAYPDCYFAHGQWCGPEFEKAAALETQMREAIRRAIVDKRFGVPMYDAAKARKILRNIAP